MRDWHVWWHSRLLAQPHPNTGLVQCSLCSCGGLVTAAICKKTKVLALNMCCYALKSTLALLERVACTSLPPRCDQKDEAPVAGEMAGDSGLKDGMRPGMWRELPVP